MDPYLHPSRDYTTSTPDAAAAFERGRVERDEVADEPDYDDDRPARCGACQGRNSWRCEWCQGTGEER